MIDQKSAWKIVPSITDEFSAGFFVSKTLEKDKD